MKKWLMLILSSVLAMGLLVGCGAGEEADTEQNVIEQPDVDTSSVEDVPASTEETTDSEEEAEEETDETAAELEESAEAEEEDAEEEEEEETAQP